MLGRILFIIFWFLIGFIDISLAFNTDNIIITFIDLVCGFYAISICTLGCTNLFFVVGDNNDKQDIKK